jgi:hypothetical protein
MTARFSFLKNRLPIPEAIGWRALFALGTVIAALVWFWSSLATLSTFALRYPAFDQYRLYSIYLGLPFPTNAVQLENGHRPILPALLRLAEIRWLAADQKLQVIVGLGAAIVSLVLLAHRFIRGRSRYDVIAAACVAQAVLGLFWLGNARVLLHGNESVQMYGVILCAVVAILTIDDSRTKFSKRSVALTCASCTAAAFCFGTGMASFMAAMLLAGFSRWRASALAILVLVFAITSGLYVIGLPGGAGIRHTLLLEPLANLKILLQWLAAPWMCAWLGHGDPILMEWWRSPVAFGNVTLESAKALGAAFGDDAVMKESLLLGAIGSIAFMIAIVDAWIHRQALPSTRFVAIGLSTFALGAGLIVCVARLDAFRQFAGEVFADRYLPWSCLFWLGLVVYALDRMPRTARFEVLAAVVTFACFVFFLPTQRSEAGWSASVFRTNQQSASASQLGIWDPTVLPDDRSSSRDSTLRSLAMLRDKRLAMFAEPEFTLASSANLDLPAPSNAESSGMARITRVFHDTLGDRDVGAFEGSLSKIHDQPKWVLLVVTDTTGRLRGLAKQSFIAYAAHSLRLTIPRSWRGFDGYVINPKAGENLRILVLDRDSLQIVTTIPLSVPPTQLAPLPGP